MLACMAIYEMTGDVPFVEPVMIAAFDGWIDASGASTAAASTLAEGGDVVARFDGDALYDYRARRPAAGRDRRNARASRMAGARTCGAWRRPAGSC